MKTLFLVLLSFTILSASAQKKDNKIVIGTIDTVYSNILKEKRTILVHIPDGDKNQRYPVLYILDGESHFQSAVAIVQQMAGVIPDMIVIGITNTIRERDLTPTHIKPDKLVGPSDANISGGGEAFIGFIEKELIPFIDNKYPSAPYRVFSGHSLGGLTVVNALINHMDLFNAYIAIDPSLWWDNEKLLKQAENEIASRNFKGKSLFVGFANNMPPGIDTNTVMNDTTNNNTLVTRSVLPFINALKNLKNKELRWGYKFYPNERHGTIELNAEYDALRYLFNYYQFRTSQFDGHPELNVDSVLADHFNKISGYFGFKVNPPEDLVNNLAYDAMGQHKSVEAYKLFKRNIENYPNSANAYDSLGDFYAGEGNKAKAIEAYSKSLSLQETPDTRRKLEELRR